MRSQARVRLATPHIVLSTRKMAQGPRQKSSLTNRREHAGVDGCQVDLEFCIPPTAYASAQMPRQPDKMRWSSPLLNPTTRPSSPKKRSLFGLISGMSKGRSQSAVTSKSDSNSMNWQSAAFPYSVIRLSAFKLKTSKRNDPYGRLTSRGVLNERAIPLLPKRSGK